MRRMVILLTGIGVLLVVNLSIVQKERVLANGRMALLQLAPVDPRSMMQGDYMALRFQLEAMVGLYEKLRDGRMVVAADDRGVATFRRLDTGGPLAADEFRLRYRVREGRVKLGTNAFFFQEGHGGDYRDAAFGEARVDENGEILLTGLRDRNLKKLGPR